MKSLMQEEYLYAEMFIDVEPVYSRLLNAHLQRFLILFDDLYERNGGTLLSTSHIFERYIVARNVCEAASRIVQNKGLSLTWLITQTEYHSSNILKPINILTKSFFQIQTEDSHNCFDINLN